MMLSRLIIYNILRWRILKLKTGRLDVYASCWPTFVGVLCVAMEKREESSTFFSVFTLKDVALLKLTVF